MENAHRFDKGGMTVALGALAVGLYVLWEAQSFTPLGSIFPLFVAGMLILATLVLVAMILLRRQRPPRPISGSLARRAALALALVVWAALVPFLGFTLASVLGFVAVGMTSKYEAWNGRSWLAFGIAAIFGVAAFCFIFTAFLNVPLPGGLLAP